MRCEAVGWDADFEESRTFFAEAGVAFDLFQRTAACIEVSKPSAGRGWLNRYP